MEFEDMQIIWNSQDNEKKFAIDENALYNQIKRKSQSIERKLAMFEFFMIAVNLIVGIVLIIEAVRENKPVYQYALPVMYLIYFLFSFVRRVFRRKQSVRFALTMLGELEKAIWQVDYLIQQGRSMILWYLMPLMIVFSVNAFIEAKLIWAFGMVFVLLPLTYFGSRWEINKFYLPKKQALEDLRETLTSPPSKSLDEAGRIVVDSM